MGEEDGGSVGERFHSRFRDGHTDMVTGKEGEYGEILFDWRFRRQTEFF